MNDYNEARHTWCKRCGWLKEEIENANDNGDMIDYTFRSVSPHTQQEGFVFTLTYNKLWMDILIPEPCMKSERQARLSIWDHIEEFIRQLKTDWGY